MATEPDTVRERLDRATVFKLALAAFVVLGLGWIGYVTFQSMTHPAAQEGSITAIKQNPEQYVGETVSLQGEVVRTTENGYVYSDGTGEIRVLSDNPPSEDANVGMVQGTVERHGDELGIVEQTRM